MPYATSPTPVFPSSSLINTPLPSGMVVFGATAGKSPQASAAAAAEAAAAAAEPTSTLFFHAAPTTTTPATTETPKVTQSLFYAGLLKSSVLSQPLFTGPIVFQGAGPGSKVARSRLSRRRHSKLAAAAPPPPPAAAAPSSAPSSSSPSRLHPRSFTLRKDLSSVPSSASSSSSSVSAALKRAPIKKPLVLTPLTPGPPHLLLCERLLHPRLCAALVRQAKRGDHGIRFGPAAVGGDGTARIDRSVRDAESAELRTTGGCSREVARALAALEKLAHRAAAAACRCGAGGGGGLDGDDDDPEGPLVREGDAMLVRYKPGGRYSEHHDHSNSDGCKRRTVTVLLYLNGGEGEEEDDDEGKGRQRQNGGGLVLRRGGATTFPRLYQLPPPPSVPAPVPNKPSEAEEAKQQAQEQEAKNKPAEKAGGSGGPLPAGVERRGPRGLAVQPRVGRALVWFNSTPSGDLLDSSCHSAEPVVSGQKWCLILWFVAANRR